MAPSKHDSTIQPERLSDDSEKSHGELTAVSDDLYEIECIYAVRKTEHGLRYSVGWFQYVPDARSWIAEEDIIVNEAVEALLARFWAEVERVHKDITRRRFAKRAPLYKKFRVSDEFAAAEAEIYFNAVLESLRLEHEHDIAHATDNGGEPEADGV
ncbi:hypothetical protein BDZ89DRAFT_1144393 [Hymenopellis radicata]|nr:hypothetical protein BDZ89DRAFT_1144393 [Hymenopellis radicata]